MKNITLNKLCSGAIELGTECQDCRRCLDSAILYINQLKRVPLIDLRESSAYELSRACHIVIEILGPMGFQSIIKKGSI